ncbi:MAG TPA: uroporphyrinogen-III synthase, partial [Rhodanobacter sp.]|nr:uroporphyrinogen-III synthase [Rhodanobacter sp.]
ATTPGIIAVLAGLELQGRRVGVQLYGVEPNAPLMDFLAGAGARALPVAPYVYADAAADAEVLTLIEKMHQGGIDAVAFTSMQQVERLFRVAEAARQGELLRQALARTMVAAIGPVVADALSARGVTAQVIPADSYYLKPLTQALIRHLGAQPDA